MDEYLEINQDNFVKILEEEFPDKRDVVKQHIEDYEGILFHILCMDIIEIPLGIMLSENRDRALIQRYCDFVEKMWKLGDDNIRNVVDVTILEGIAQEDINWQVFGQYISEDFKTYINYELMKWNAMMWNCEPIK